MWPKLTAKAHSKGLSWRAAGRDFFWSVHLCGRGETEVRRLWNVGVTTLSKSQQVLRKTPSHFSVPMWLFGSPLALAIHQLCQLSNLNTITTITMIHHNAESMQDDTHGAQKYLSKRQAFNDKVSASIFCVPWASCSDRAGRPALQFPRSFQSAVVGLPFCGLESLWQQGTLGAPYKRNSVRSSACRIQRGVTCTGLKPGEENQEAI